MNHFQTNTKVSWNWANGKAFGYVREKFTQDVKKNIDGNEVVRKASSSKPAYMIEQADGQRVLKSSSELSKAKE